MVRRKEIEQAAAAWEAGDELAAARIIYEHLEREQRPAWAARLLELACRAVDVPTVVTMVLEIAANDRRWPEAHEAFQQVRRVVLGRQTAADGNDRLDALLDLAEKTAKVIYNASGSAAPFDYNSGWKIGPSLRRLLIAIGDPELTEIARKALLLNPMDP